MESQEQVYHSYLEKLRLKLISKYDELGLRASGDYADALEGSVQGNKIVMFGAKHSEYLEHGRTSGKFPPIKMIEDWIDIKPGLPSIFREKKKQFAFLIARKIATEGIKVPNQYNKGKVIADVVDSFLANDIEEMLEELGNVFLARIKVDILQIFKQVA